MRLINYKHNNINRCGALLQDWLVDMNRAARYLLEITGDVSFISLSGLEKPDWFIYTNESTKVEVQKAMKELYDCLQELKSELLEEKVLIPLADVEFLPSVREPRKIVCVGLNYPEPGESKPTSSPAYPVLFLKPTSTLNAHGLPIILPRISRQVLCEGELAIVIGRSGKHISPQHAWSHIAGYTIANDVGAKDLEQRTSQWTSGKISDTFCPLGPALVTADEVPDPQNLEIQTTVDGEIVLEGNTAQMIYDMPTLISYISEITTLEPGDLILTGSPKGIGALPTQGQPLQHGNVVAIEIERLGKLVNPVIAEE